MKTLDLSLIIGATLASATIAVIGAQTLLTAPITLWGGVSMTVSLLMLVITTVAAYMYRGSYFAIAAHIYGTVLVGRLFSTLRLDAPIAASGAALDPLLVGETGPGIPMITYLSYILVAIIFTQFVRLVIQTSEHNKTEARDLSINDWAMTFIRLYVGLMFIAHYSGHVLAGPIQFQIFVDYFSTVGFQIGGPMVVLAGLIEIVVSIGLVFGLLTRLAAIIAVLYLFFATLWGDHFAAGYIWVLPKGGWEFSALWMATILVFTTTGGGKISLDKLIRNIAPKKIAWIFH